jgi:hypothetical protein
MSHPCKLDQRAYANALSGIKALELVERKGSHADFALFYEDRWLSDTAVVEYVARIRGMWRVELVFAHVHNPLRFIKRHITTKPDHKQAAQQAYYMRRLAAKDQRGTLTLSVKQFGLCPN